MCFACTPFAGALADAMSCRALGGERDRGAAAPVDQAGPPIGHQG